MNDRTDVFEENLGRHLRQHVAAVNLQMAASDVLRDVAQRNARQSGWRMRPLAATFVVGAIAVAGSLAAYGALGGFGSGSSSARATVSGTRYDVGAGLSLQVAPSDMTQYGEVTDTPLAWAFAQPLAYALKGVDPQALLLAPAKPELGDDWGAYIILWGPGQPFPAVCRYFEVGSPATPTECQ